MEERVRLKLGRDHRRAMTLRGRITLAVAGLALALGLRAVAIGGDAGSAPVGPVASGPARSEPVLPARLLERLPLHAGLYDAGASEGPPPGTRLVERVGGSAPGGPYEIEYTFDVALTRAVHEVLREGRVALGHVVVIDPASGDLLAYATTDPEAFPPTAPYPAASLVKVVTAAAALDDGSELPTCRSQGSPWRVSRSQLTPPPGGRPVSMRRALATSNNQCFAQLAVGSLGSERMLSALRRFGWLESPAPAHGAGEAADPGDDDLALGRLGCGLDGCRITPLHAASLAATLSDGMRRRPRWIASIRDAKGRGVDLPAIPPPERVLSPKLAGELREMLVDTTERGTARKAFRRRGRPLLKPIRVAGKTGSLNGRNPTGRYEWFIAAAPAHEPRVALAVLVVYGKTWYLTPAQISAEVLKTLFCPRGVCREEAIERWLPPRG